jgi:hypothetical protein
VTRRRMLRDRSVARTRMTYLGSRRCFVLALLNRRIYITRSPACIATQFPRPASPVPPSPTQSRYGDSSLGSTISGHFRESHVGLLRR